MVSLCWCAVKQLINQLINICLVCLLIHVCVRARTRARATMRGVCVCSCVRVFICCACMNWPESCLFSRASASIFSSSSLMTIRLRVNSAASFWFSASACCAWPDDSSTCRCSSMIVCSDCFNLLALSWALATAWGNNESSITLKAAV